MGWSKKLKRVGKAVATGGLFEIPYATGQVGAQRDADKALRGLGSTTDQILGITDAGLESQQNTLDQTFSQQQNQINDALAAANRGDTSALNQFIASQEGSNNAIANLLQPQADLQGQYMGAVTMDPGQRLNALRNSDQYGALRDERLDTASNYFADQGIRRNSAAGDQVADISQQTLMDLDNQNYGRDLNLFNTGLAGTQNLANFQNQANSNLNNIALGIRRDMNNRGFQTGLSISDLIGNKGTNMLNLQGQADANRINAIGQLGQAQAANTIAQGQNNMAMNMGLLNAGAGIFGGALAGGLFNQGAQRQG